jgi:hypothetical protein
LRSCLALDGSSLPESLVGCRKKAFEGVPPLTQDDVVVEKMIAIVSDDVAATFTVAAS